MNEEKLCGGSNDGWGDHRDDCGYNEVTVVITLAKNTDTSREADSGLGGATVIDSFTPKFQDIGEPGLG